MKTNESHSASDIDGAVDPTTSRGSHQVLDENAVANHARMKGVFRPLNEDAVTRVVILVVSLIAGVAIIYHGTPAVTTLQDQASASVADQSPTEHDKLNPVPATVLIFGQDSDPAVFAFPPDKTLLAAASRDGTTRVWVIRTGQLIATLRLMHGRQDSHEYVAAST